MKRLRLLLMFFGLWPQFAAHAVPARLVRTYTLPREPPDTAPNSVVALALSPDGSTVAYASGSGDSGNLFLWDLRTGRQHLVERDTSDVAFSPDGCLIAYVHTYFSRPHYMGSMFAALSVYDLKARRHLSSVVLPEGFMGGLAFSPDGKTVACGDDPLLGAPTEVLIYWTPTLTLQSKLVAHIAKPYSIAFSDDGHYLGASAYAGENAVGNTAVWSINDHRLQHVFDDDGRVFFAPHRHTLIFKSYAFAKTQQSHGLLPLVLVGKNRFLFCRLDSRG